MIGWYFISWFKILVLDVRLLKKYLIGNCRMAHQINDMKPSVHFTHQLRAVLVRLRSCSVLCCCPFADVMELIQIYVAMPGRAQRVGMDVSVQLWLRMGAWGEGGCCCSLPCVSAPREVPAPRHPGRIDPWPWAPELRPPHWREWEGEEGDPHHSLPGVFLN